MQVQKLKPGYKLVQNFFKKQFEIPEEWNYPKFSKVVKVNSPTKILSPRAAYIPMDAVDTENPHVNYYEERLAENSSLPKFQQNDVLFARITPSTENGKTAIIENFKGQGIASSELTILRPTEKVIPRYLYYYVKSHKIRQFAISQMMGTTGRQRVPDFVFKKDLNFELPSIREQKKITSILSNIDSIINQTENIIEQTKKLKKGLLQKLLSRGIGHTKFKKVKWYFGKEIDIPKEWNSHPFSYGIKFLTDFEANGSYAILNENATVGKGIPYAWFVRSIDLGNNRIGLVKGNQYCSKSVYNFLKKTKVFGGELLIMKVGANVGNVYLLPKLDAPATIGNNLFLIHTNENLLKEYAFFWFKNFVGKNLLINASTSGSYQSLNKDSTKNCLFLFPPVKEQKQIVSILSMVDLRIKFLELKKSHLQSLKKGLMQKLLTGQIRVKV